MNLRALKAAEKEFLKMYPGGFKHPEMVEIGKKHKMDKLTEFAKTSFSKSQFDDEEEVLSNVTKLIARSTMVSMFEKPKFRDLIKTLSNKSKETLVEAYYEILHGKEKYGFELLVSELRKHKLAKWPLVTAVQAYHKPQKEVFIKPTTTKLIIDHLDLDLKYQPLPTWDFYKEYRKDIKLMKSKVGKSLSPNNPAFCGFLMMTLG
ncbi:MAG: hypothetical protein KDD50_04640 [Bdellovibrionales bacterium]|nr:hypothetical protein [Bdellovibrionales bacterium]